ncbi:MAG: hypothetical protein KatS3mg027_1889 [Bacteroidia bacterium]|nr:MAG: hypothetical protein KatS3mg027_1889 [Bacteroidia bacterium]
MVHPCCIPTNLPQTPDFWNNTSASLVSATANYIVINGIFTVNQNLTLVNKQIYLGPDAKIDLTSGNSLTLRNCTLQAGCNYMWDGIYTEAPNSFVGIYKQSKIQDAKNAIVSRNGGDFTVSGSYLIKTTNIL